MVPLSELKAYDNNAKRHTREQIDAVEASIREFGFRGFVLAWHNEDGVPEIVAGHARCKAAQNLGMSAVPVVFCDDLSDAQRRALTLVDNQTTMLTGWDMDLLAYELDTLSDSFDMGDFGFADASEPDDIYTDKVEGLIYEPSGVKPDAEDLCDLSKVEKLKALVTDADVPDELKRVLYAACYRFADFDYARIADFYANGTEEERAAIVALSLVIVDDGSIEKAAREFVSTGEGMMKRVRRSDSV